MRVPFSQIFQINQNGMITPLTVVKLGGVTMGPGVAFGGGVSIGGVELTSLVGKDLEVQNQPDGSVEITGYHQY
ncbi:MAG: hypothetical protein H8D23_15015 [Candidatus Brocadiales bacterium]|nr:hypothetical protein [Candidatus Brocadiales bacterium]